MLKTLKSIIIPTIWLNLKSLRMNFMQYFMMVILYPLTFLIISYVSRGNDENIYYFTGMFLSMLISLFINMQAMLIASSNNATVIEMYTVFQVPPIYAFMGQCMFHAIMSLPIFGVMLISVMLKGYTISIIKVVFWCLFALLFFSVLSIFIGGLIRNPNFAMPMISMLYMIIVIITPIYNNVLLMEETTKLLYLVNPVSHIVSLLYWVMGMKTLVNPIISIILIASLSLILGVICIVRWKDTKALEKLNLL